MVQQRHRLGRIVQPDPTKQRLGPIRRVPPGEYTPRNGEAVLIAARADMILLAVGDQPEVTREAVTRVAAGHRATLGLLGDQNALVEAMIATSKATFALLINGRPLAVARLAEKATL